MPLRCPRLKYIADVNLLMQMRGNQPFTFDADPVETIRRRTRKAVGANVHLTVEGETQRQMLAGEKYRQTGAIGRLQINRADVTALRFDPRHAQRPPLITQCLRLQTRVGFGPVTG